MAPSVAAEAVAEGLAEAGVSGDPPLDLFAFDTCLMAGTEVVWEFRELAAVYIGNAEIDYGDGWRGRPRGAPLPGR